MATQVVNIIVRGKDEVSGVFNDIGKNIGGKGGLAGAIGKVGLIAGGAVVAGVGAAAAGMTAFAAGGVNKAVALEQQMANIASVMGKTRDQVAPLNDLILDLGMAPDLKVDTFEAAQAIELLARNGLQMDQIMQGAAKSAIQLANATGADFGGAADVATDVMALWNIEAGNMAQAVDGITSVVTNSKFSFDDFRLALAQGGGVAAAVGVDFEDFTTSIAGIAPLFASGSDAGTSFKVFLQRLVPQSNKAIEAMADLGIIAEDGSNRFFDASGNMKSMAEISGILAEATAGLSEEQMNQTFATIFGTDAMRAAFGVAKLGEKGFRDLQATMGETSAAKAVETRMDTLSGQMEILRGTIEALAIKVGQRFLPILKDIVKAIQNFVSEHGDMLVEFFARVAEFTVAALPALFNFASIILDLGRYLFAVLQDGDTLNDWLTNLPAPIQPVVKALGEFANFLREGIPVAIKFLSDFWTNVLLPAIQQVITFINGVVVPVFAKLLEFILTNLPIAIEFFSDLWTRVLLPSIKQAVDFIEGVVIPVVLQIVDAFLKFVDFVSANVIPVISEIAGWVVTMLEKFTQARGAIIDFVAQLVSGMGGLGESNDLIMAFSAAWDFVKAALQSAWEVIQPIWTRFVENFSEGFSKFNTLLPALAKLWEALKPIVIGAIVVIGAALAGLIGLVVGVLSGIAEAIGPFLSGLALLVEGIINVVSGLADIFVGIFELIVGIVTGDGEKIKDAFSRMGRGLVSIWDGLVGIFEGLIIGVFGTIFEFIKGFVIGIVEFFEGLYDALVGGSIIPNLVARIIFLFFNLKETALSILAELVFGAINLGREMISGLAGAIEDGISTVSGAIGNVVNSAIDSAKGWLGIGSPSKIFAAMGLNIGEGLIGGIHDSMAIENLGRYLLDVVQTGDTLNDWLTHLPTLLQPIAKGVGEFVNTILNLGRYLLDVVQTGDTLNDWLTHLPTLLQPIIIGWGEFVNVLREGVLIAIEFLFNLKDTALSILGELVFGAISLGHDMISGLVGAIENGVSAVSGAIGNVVNSAINSAKDWLGIGSASRVFAEMGLNIGEGLTGGMRNSMAMVRKEAASLGGATFGLGANVPALAAGGGGPTNITVNIDGVSVSNTTNGGNPNDQAILLTLNLLTKALQARGATG